MKIIIHSGKNVIGSACVEIATKKTRILLDFGYPLTDGKGGQFDFSLIKNKTKDELLKSNLISDINGLYKEEKPLIDVVLLTHAHPDHYGFFNFIHPDIPFYMSEGTKKMIEIREYFSGYTFNKSNIKIIEDKKSFSIGDMVITPYSVDHSVFDGFSFLIEGEGERAFYTGDFRGHGNTSYRFDNLIKNPPKSIDYLITEGTNLGNNYNGCKSETEVYEDLEKIFKINNKVIVINSSSQNIDRIVSIYKACRKCKKTFVIDPYTAYILNEINYLKNIPQHDWDNIKVYFVKHPYTDKLAENNELNKFSSAIISIKGIKENKENLVFLHNKKTTEKLFTENLLNNALYIHSLWKGYLKDEDSSFWKKLNCEIKFVHTSGHATNNEIEEFIKALNPKKIYFMHTEYAGDYKSIFKDENFINKIVNWE